MRFLPAFAVAALALAPLPSWAQAASLVTATGSVPATNPLTITTPPGSVVTFEADGREGDLLGLIKNLVGEMEKSMEKSAGSTPASPRASKAIGLLAPFSGFFADRKLTDLLKDVTHAHVVVYKKTATTASTAAINGFGETSALASLDHLAFHEKSLMNEGGRRLLYANEGGRYLMTGFDTPRGMAVVVDDGNRVTVVRTEGIIDFKATAAVLLALGGLGATEEEAAATPAATLPAGTAASVRTVPVAKAAPNKSAPKAPSTKPRG